MSILQKFELAAASGVDVVNDRRKNKRYRIGGAVSFHWRDEMGRERRDTGRLRNLSTAGLFIDTHVDPPPTGTELNLEFDFDGLKRSVLVKAKGRITRVESAGAAEQSSSFAVVTIRMRLQEPSAI